MHVGAHFRTIRLQRGWTQTDLAYHSRVSASEISKIETGRLVPSRTQRKRLADVLGIPRGEVLAEDDDVEQVSE